MDKPIHLRHYPICEIKEHTEDCVHANIWITQSSLDGMNQVMSFLEGFEKSGKGRVDGAFELVMFYRTIRDCIEKESKKKEE